MNKKLVIGFIVLVMSIPSGLWSEVQLSFAPILSATYTSDSNVFSEKDDPQKATSYELLPGVRLTATIGKKLRTSLSGRYTLSQYIEPAQSKLEDEAENRGLERDSVVPFQSSTVSWLTEYLFTPKFSSDLSLVYEVSGVPSYESGYFIHSGVSPGIWYNLTRFTSLNCAYQFNQYLYPLKEIPEDTVLQNDQESGGQVSINQRIFKSTRIGITYQSSVNNSNDDQWDYQNNNGYLNLWQSFGKHVFLQVTGHLRQRIYRDYAAIDPDDADLDEKRLDNFTGVYNSFTFQVNDYLSFNLGYDSLNNISNHRDANYVKSFVYAGITLTPGNYKKSF